MRSNDEFYRELGLGSGASESDIKKAYRKLARENHPDTNKDPGAMAKFQELVEAYQALKAPTKRDDYDAQVIAEYCRSVVGSFDFDTQPEPRVPALLRILRKKG